MIKDKDMFFDDFIGSSSFSIPPNEGQKVTTDTNKKNMNLKDGDKVSGVMNIEYSYTLSPAEYPAEIETRTQEDTKIVKKIV